MFRKVNKKIICLGAVVVAMIFVSTAIYVVHSRQKSEDITVLNEPSEDEIEDEVEETETLPETVEAAPETLNNDTAVNNEVKKEEQQAQKQPAVESQPSNKASNAAPEQKKQVVQPASVATTYRSDNIGIELTLPANWQNKYIVNKTNDGIIVSYIFQHDYYIDYYGNRYSRGDSKARYLFCIRDTALLDENSLSTIDTINNVERFKTIHGKKYVIGGPTDCLEKNDPDRPEVEQFLRDLPGIINSIKEV